MRVNCNISAIIANTQLSSTETALSQSIERLSSGLRINHASDDASGMAVSKKMHTQIKALERATSNTGDGISVVQTAEASLGEMENILQRMRELAVQSASDTNTASDREALQSEVEMLQKEVDRISTDTEYNTMPLLDGTLRRRAFAKSEQDGIAMFDMSNSVANGQYHFTVDAGDAAQYAEATMNLDSLAGTDGTVRINGAEVAVSADDTEEEIYDKLAEACNTAGLSYTRSGSSVTITENVAGSAHTLQITPSESYYGASIVDGATFDEDNKTYTATGTDATLTLDTGSGFSATASVTADGNIIRVRDVNSFEMEFEIPVGEAVDATFNVTQIGTMSIQAGAGEGQQIDIDIPEVNCHTLNIDKINIATDHRAGEAITALDEAINKVSSIRSKLGAYQNRLETTQSNLATYNENLTSALSGMEDCDMAEEMTEFTTQNVKTQAATSVLAQANERPQTVLQLLQ